MLSQFYQLFSQKIRPLFSRSKWAVMLLLLALCVSCTSAKPPGIDLKLSVQPESRPGLYNVIGSTNLPDNSQVIVTAIRYLRATNQDVLGPDPNATYSILARQIVEVNKGKLQASLNLWQVAPDGRYREPWQINQAAMEISHSPEIQVSFVAIYDPAGQLPTSKEKKGQTQELRGSLVRFTNEGLPYVQTSQTLQIALPVGRRPPPGLRPEDVNYGWGNRYEIKPEPPVTNRIRPQLIKTDQTNAPVSPSEFLR